MTEEPKKNHWYEMYELECLKTKELEKENAELKCECRRCVYTDCPCILSDYGKDRNGICDHFKDVFDENAELEEVLEKTQKDLELVNHYKNDYIRELEQERNLSQCRFDHNEQLRETVNKARNLVHRLLVLIQKHKWWDYTVIDEARLFMSEVDRDKDND